MPVTNMQPQLVIVGNGMVSWALCRALVARGLHQRFRMVVVGEEPVPAYDRIHLSDLLDGGKPQQLQLSDHGWYVSHGITLLTGVRALRIEPRLRALFLQHVPLPLLYHHLILATGAEARRPALPGANLPGVLCYRDLADMEAIRQRLTGGGSLAIIGGGLLGLELAVAVRRRGHEVTVLERSPAPLIRQLNPTAAGLLRTLLQEQGIQVRVNARTCAIAQVHDGLVVRLDDGGTAVASTVVCATGVRPRDQLARAAGLRCAADGGIIVNEHLATSDAHISALGDCVSFQTYRYGLVAPGYQMAEVLAERLLGNARAAFVHQSEATSLKTEGIDVHVLGDPLADGQVVAWRDQRHYRQLVLHRGRLYGATVVGAWDQLDRLRDAVTRQQRLGPADIQRFSREGRIWAAESGLAAWPDAAIVCNCRLVRMGTLRAACRAGSNTVAQLGQACGAGTVCGSCKPLLMQLVDQKLRGPQPWPKTLLWLGAGSAALALISLPLTLPALTSWEHPGLGLGVLWEHPLIKHISGWTLVVLGVSALPLALRRRSIFLKFGEYPTWRIVHLIIGCLALLGLAAHTGMREGHQLNAVLGYGFLALCGLGGLGTVALAWEQASNGAHGTTLRLSLIRTHLMLLVLLLPVLIFHILTAYYY